jgi:hypothetical protein
VPTVAEFRRSLIGADVLDIVDTFLLSTGAAHVSDENLKYIANSLAANYGVTSNQVEIVITGSAKLGFSISEKRSGGGSTLSRYRNFSAASDIDVAVISAPIFDAIWHELSSHYHRNPWFPPDTGRLGDYLVSGWLRPDYFPKHVRLPRCDAWWNTFRKLSANTRFQRRRLNGGAFNSREHLRQYLSRAVRECISIEESP